MGENKEIRYEPDFLTSRWLFRLGILLGIIGIAISWEQTLSLVKGLAFGAVGLDNYSSEVSAFSGYSTCSFFLGMIILIVHIKALVNYEHGSEFHQSILESEELNDEDIRLLMIELKLGKHPLMKEEE